MKKTIDAGKQLQLLISKSEKVAEAEIIISTESEDENLKLDAGIVENPNN